MKPHKLTAEALYEKKVKETNIAYDRFVDEINAKRKCILETLRNCYAKPDIKN